MSAKEPDQVHGDDYSHPHDHDHDHDAAPLAPIAATPEHGYWKSLRELAGTASWQEQPSAKEFPPGADQPTALDPMSRRNFFHLMGASAGLAGLGAAAAGCRRYEKEEIVPLARRPEDQIPGTTLQYATVYDLGGVAHPLVATSFEGRPIHLDGNPEHPYAGGGVNPATKRKAGAHTFAQASILHVYDSDRSQNPLSGGKGASIDEFKVALSDLVKTTGAGTTRILSEASSSPTLAALKAQLAGKNIRWHEYEPISWDNERVGLQAAFGKVVRPLARLDKCETIVALDCDLFVEHPASMRYSRDFAKSRRRDGTSLLPGAMNRLWSIESIFSNTGAISDHRLPLRSELGLPFALALDAAISGGAAPAAEFLKEEKIAKFIAVLAEELKANAGKAVIVAGRRQPAEVHALVAKLNQAIGAPGATLDYIDDADQARDTHVASIAALAKDMHDGHVETLFIFGGNPVYDAPVDIDFTGALAKVKTSIHLSEYADETSLKTSWHVPKAHFLEAWGDARTPDGTITLAQPLIAPLYGGLSSIELASLILGDGKGGMELVSAQHAGKGVWRSMVHDGFVPNSTATPATVTYGTPTIPAPTPSQLTGTKRGKNELEVTFHMSYATYDGRYANNAWLWETPDFLTKVTWDNYAMVSPETATAIGVDNDTLITVKLGDRSIELPCYTMPGQAKYSIALVLGGGRTAAGHVATHPKNVTDEVPGKKVVGWDTYKVRTVAGARRLRDGAQRRRGPADASARRHRRPHRGGAAAQGVHDRVPDRALCQGPGRADGAGLGGGGRRRPPRGRLAQGNRRDGDRRHQRRQGRRRPAGRRRSRHRPSPRGRRRPRPGDHGRQGRRGGARRHRRGELGRVAGERRAARADRQLWQCRRRSDRGQSGRASRQGVAVRHPSDAVRLLRDRAGAAGWHRPAVRDGAVGRSDPRDRPDLRPAGRGRGASRAGGGRHAWEQRTAALVSSRRASIRSATLSTWPRQIGPPMIGMSAARMFARSAGESSLSSRVTPSSMFRAATRTVSVIVTPASLNGARSTHHRVGPRSMPVSRSRVQFRAMAPSGR